MTAEERKEYNKAYREAHREYFAKKQAEYREKERKRIAAMETELAKKRDNERFLNTIFGWAMSLDKKVEFVPAEDAEETEG